MYYYFFVAPYRLFWDFWNFWGSFLVWILSSHNFENVFAITIHIFVGQFSKTSFIFALYRFFFLTLGGLFLVWFFSFGNFGHVFAIRIPTFRGSVL